MSEIASQFAAGVAQAMGALAVPATYTRVDTKATVLLNVALAAPLLEEAASSGVILSAESWEMYVTAADLAFSGSVYEPQPGDTLLISSGGTDTTYIVTMPNGARDCWTWADRFRVRRRLCVKVNNQAPTPP